MKRTMFVMVVVAVLMGISTNAMASTARAISRERFRDSYVYRSRPVVVGSIDYDYGCDYGWYGRGNCHNSYPSGSLLSDLLGLPTYNDEQYWAYQNRILDLGEKGLGRQSEDQSYVKDQKLLSEANQRGKIQKLEERIAELEKILAGKSGK